jgi:threonine aldolase
MIDLRSDTITRPSKEMREYMLSVPVGDDVYGEDPTTNDLQEYVADLFGKEAGLFVPTGTMSNQILLSLNTSPGDEIIADADAHIFYYENAAPARLYGAQIFPVHSVRGEMPLEKIEAAIRPDIYYFPKTQIIALENTHNRHGGTILSLEYIQSVKELADKNKIKMHLDGARIWNAHSITNIPLSEYAKYFDTISVCFSKGLGAPVGSMMLSDKGTIRRAWKTRKTFGGGMRQSGILAAAAKYALINNLPKLKEDFEKATAFVKSLSESHNFPADKIKVETNIVRFAVSNEIVVDKLISELAVNGVHAAGIGGQNIRVVFHLDVTYQDALSAAEIIKSISEKLIKK